MSSGILFNLQPWVGKDNEEVKGIIEEISRQKKFIQTLEDRSSVFEQDAERVKQQIAQLENERLAL